MKALILCALAVLSIGSALSRPITGEVYIRTKGGETLLGSAIQVSFYYPSDLPAWQQRHRAAIDPLRRSMEAARKKSSEQSSTSASRAALEAIYAYRDALLNPSSTAPTAVATCVTDSKGVFACEIPDGVPLVIVARFERVVGEVPDPYLWCLPVTEKPGVHLLLNNTNTGDLVGEK